MYRYNAINDHSYHLLIRHSRQVRYINSVRLIIPFDLKTNDKQPTHSKICDLRQFPSINPTTAK